MDPSTERYSGIRSYSTNPEGGCANPRGLQLFGPGHDADRPGHGHRLPPRELDLDRQRTVPRFEIGKIQLDCPQYGAQSVRTGLFPCHHHRLVWLDDPQKLTEAGHNAASPMCHRDGCKRLLVKTAFPS